jgi:hypothetical protein
MKKENIVKFFLVLGGGFIVFTLLKPTITKNSVKAQDKKFEGDKDKMQVSEKELENAEIVANAYMEALKQGESPDRLTELNKELMKEFEMRCYLDKSNKIVVCDTKGKTIMTK